MFDHIKAFETKLHFWESQIRKNNFAHFPALQKHTVSDSQKYARIISELMEQFNTRLQDFKKNTVSFNFYSRPFSISIDDIPEDLNSSRRRHPRIYKRAILMIFLFGSTYLCEQVFSRMKHVKFTSRSLLHVATSSIMSDIGKLIGGKQCQFSH
ncbi:hypothetical protein PR048_027221 [Dryococelus australis]|uniref:HAT C-terminal dimerisation domain-containing protein n=1 Tax=Dryococelus australis TaxID=614101 RepID=A0ABQ9GET8_9NEOP|nr:hypothetical protein PR048_027221 [Dryococelus australis]